MTENELIREVFGLGSPIPALSAHQSNRPSKHQRVRSIHFILSFFLKKNDIDFPLKLFKSFARKKRNIFLIMPNVKKKLGKK